MEKRTLRAFTLIEFILVFAILGILAVIAIPVYMDFTLRTRVAELLVAASKLKHEVAENAQHEGGILDRAGAGLTVVTGGKVTGGNVTDNGIITISGSPETIGTAVTLTLVPSRNSDGKVIWACTSATSVHRYVPRECRN